MNKRVVLVTGCSSGFGALIARGLGAQGYHVFASMRNVATSNERAASELRDWSERHGTAIEVVDMDVTSDASVHACVNHVVTRAGRIDVVINNAAASAIGPIEAFSLAQAEALFSINLFGALRVDKAVLPSMRARRSGLLLHISSTLGRVLPFSGGLYHSTKWALEGLAESLSYQLRPFGIDAILLEPGGYPTPSLGNAMLALDSSITDEYAAVDPPPADPSDNQPDETYVVPDPQEVADVIAHLIDLPSGHRPLRTVVGHIFTEGVSDYNEAYERARKRLADALRRPDQVQVWAPPA